MVGSDGGGEELDRFVGLVGQNTTLTSGQDQNIFQQMPATSSFAVNAKLKQSIPMFVEYPANI